MSHVPHISPPRAMYGLFVCLAVVITLGGCSSSTRLAMSDRPVPQPRPAVRPMPPPAPVPAMKSALGRPDTPPTQVYTWNGSPNRIAEGAPPHHAAPRAAAGQRLDTVTAADPLHTQARAHPTTPPHPAAQPLPPPGHAAGLPSAPVHLPRGSILVQPGDTLYGLSRRHNVSISALMDINKLTSLSLVPGQVLRLPAGGRTRG